MIAVLLAAGAIAFDRTMSCPVPIQGGVPVVRVQAHSTYSTVTFGKKYSVVSNVGLLDVQGAGLGALSGLAGGYGFPADTACKPTAPVPAGRPGLPLYDVFKPGEPGLGSMDNGATCLVGAHVRVRVRAVVRGGRASSGTVALWTGAKELRPVAFVDWTPKRVAVYMSDDCHA